MPVHKSMHMRCICACGKVIRAEDEKDRQPLSVTGRVNEQLLVGY